MDKSMHNYHYEITRHCPWIDDAFSRTRLFYVCEHKTIVLYGRFLDVEM